MGPNLDCVGNKANMPNVKFLYLKVHDLSTSPPTSLLVLTVPEFGKPFLFLSFRFGLKFHPVFSTTWNFSFKFYITKFNSPVSQNICPAIYINIQASLPNELLPKTGQADCCQKSDLNTWLEHSVTTTQTNQSKLHPSLDPLSFILSVDTLGTAPFWASELSPSARHWQPLLSITTLSHHPHSRFQYPKDLAPLPGKLTPHSKESISPLSM